MENSSTGQTPSHSEIANLAEAIYVESGRIPGRDVENWLAAEAQIKQRQNQPKIQQTQSKAQHLPQKTEEKSKQLNGSHSRRSQLATH